MGRPQIPRNVLRGVSFLASTPRTCPFTRVVPCAHVCWPLCLCAAVSLAGRTRVLDNHDNHDRCERVTHHKALLEFQRAVQRSVCPGRRVELTRGLCVQRSGHGVRRFTYHTLFCPTPMPDITYSVLLAGGSDSAANGEYMHAGFDTRYVRGDFTLYKCESSDTWRINKKGVSGSSYRYMGCVIADATHLTKQCCNQGSVEQKNGGSACPVFKAVSGIVCLRADCLNIGGRWHVAASTTRAALPVAARRSSVMPCLVSSCPQPLSELDLA